MQKTIKTNCFLVSPLLDGTRGTHKGKEAGSYTQRQGYSKDLSVRKDFNHLGMPCTWAGLIFLNSILNVFSTSN